ncbi:MAG: hypothetical protein ACYS1A_12355 [Planctomycetota bacterium]|jgi:hypothetical protein
MIKIMRITSIKAAVLTTALVIASPVVFGARSNESIEEFLKLPGVVDEFKKARGKKAIKGDSQISPLVKEAQSFALYLNPPPPKPKKKPTVAKKYKPKVNLKPTAPVSSQFKLIGTSLYASRPELSLALIDEPGKGFRWVRQSSSVGHLVIEEVKDGLVVIRDGKRTYELPALRKPRKSLLRDKGVSAGQTSSKSILSGKAAAVTGDKASMPGAEETAQGEEMMEDIIKKMEVMAKPDSAETQRSAEESETAMQEVLSAIEAMRAHSEESKKLSDLGRELKDTEQKPSRIKSRRGRRPRTRRDTQGSSKIQTSAPEPNSTEKE